MDVTIIGCGYVGLVTGTCLASIGHNVRGVEKDARKLKTLLDGHCPIFEPGLQELMQENYACVLPVALELLVDKLRIVGAVLRAQRFSQAKQ